MHFAPACAPGLSAGLFEVVLARHPLVPDVSRIVEEKKVAATDHSLLRDSRCEAFNVNTCMEPCTTTPVKIHLARFPFIPVFKTVNSLMCKSA